MYPILFHWGPFTLRTFGLMFAIGFAASIWVVMRRSKRWGFPVDPVLTLCFLLIVAGVLGARLAYVLMHIPEFQGRWLATINPFAGPQFGLAGLNLYGGVVLALIVALWYAWRQKLPILGTLDLLAPAVGMGIFVARWGCFFNGCCFGIPTKLPWGITFPKDSLPYYVFGSQPLHPAQIYSSLYGLALFFLAIWVDNRKRWFGFTVAIFLMAESTLRTLIEPLRYYEGAMHVHLFGADLTYNELFSVVLFSFGLILLVWYLPRYGQKAEFLKPNFGEKS